jgi:hypothetical protein
MTTPERRAAEAMCICTNVSGHMAGCPAGNSMQVNRVSLAIQDAIAQAQTDLAGAEATAETLRLALAEKVERTGAEQAAINEFPKLQAWAMSLAEQHDSLRAQFTQAEQRGRALEAALARYAQYEEGCCAPLIRAVEARVPNPCNCGLDAALTPPEGAA